jgi:nitroreductase
MDFLDLVRSRRSVRNYLNKEISSSNYEKCIEAARLSPSACNSQPWKFVVVSKKSLRDKIATTVFSGAYKMNAFATNAAGYIAIVSERPKIAASLGAFLRFISFRQIDAGIACSHLILQAQALGIGTCILGWFNERKLKRIISVPRSKKIILLIALGYPSDTTPSERSLKETSDIISYNRY